MKEEIAFEFTGKNKKKIVTAVLNKPAKGHYKNDLIRLTTQSENKSGEINVLMTPYEALIIANALNQAVLIHKESNQRFLK